MKHPDFFDLFVALTGHAPLSDVYLPENRQARVRLIVDLPGTVRFTSLADCASAAVHGRLAEGLPAWLE